MDFIFGLVYLLLIKDPRPLGLKSWGGDGYLLSFDVVTDPGAILFNKEKVSKYLLLSNEVEGFLGAWGVKMFCIAGDWEGDWQVLQRYAPTRLKSFFFLAALYKALLANG